jgi:hypothetical protein
MTTVRDHLWMWGHPAGSHDVDFKLPRASRMTPAEAAFYLNVPNMLMVAFAGKPEPEEFDLYARSFAPLKHVVWSIIGDSSSTRNNEQSDLEPVLKLAEAFPNINGAIMDDFFHPVNEAGACSRVSVAELANFRARLHAAPSPLDLWVVLYRHDLHLPVQAHLEQCDVVTYWTWEPENLAHLEEDFHTVETLAPGKRKVLGIYMHDFSAAKEISLDAMRHQCDLGLRWLEEGRIEGMIFLASCISDLNYPAVEWSRDWIARVGDRELATR